MTFSVHAESSSGSGGNTPAEAARATKDAAIVGAALMKSSWVTGIKHSKGALLGTLLVVVGVYANTLWNGFVYDDLQNVVQNPWIKSSGFIPEIFGSHMGGFNPEFATGYYRPFIHIAHMIVYQAAGLNPAAFHLFNVLLHAVNCILTLLIGRELMRKWEPTSHREGPAALAIALVFATHPVHSESVAWVSGISDLAYTAFALSAFLIYIQEGRSGPIRYWVSGALFFAATLCKEPALVLLPLIVMYERAFRGSDRSTIRSGHLERLLPFGIALGLYLVLRIHALGGFGPAGRPHPYGPLVSVLSALDLFVRYVYTLFLPVNLKAVHVFRPVESLLDTRALVGLAASVGIAATAWQLRRHPLATMGLAFLLLPLAPVLYIPAIGEGAFFERYLYLPVFGFAILITLCAHVAIERCPWTKAGAISLLVLLVLGYAAEAASRSLAWKDSLTLWSDTARKLPDSAVAQEYLCFAQYEAKQFREALQSCRRALALDEERIDAQTNLATTLSVLGDLDGAIREFQKILRRRPNSAEALTNLGLVYMAKGQPGRALETYRRALRANPYYAEAHNNLGVALAMRGQRQEAILEFSAAVRLAPDNPDYASNLAAAKTGLIGGPAQGQVTDTGTPAQ